MDSATTRAWTALGATGPASATGPPLGPVERCGTPGLPARLPVAGLARTCVTVCALAAAEFHRPGAAVRVDDDTIATAFTSERHLRVDGRAPTTFAPLSRFWATSDGWLRTHANYPHHRARLLASLGVPDTGDEEAAVAAVGAALAGRHGREVEEEVQAAGGLAVAVRDRAEWAASPQGAAAATRPLPELTRLDDAVGDEVPPQPSGLRVLDLTRVIAGPVATRTLALLGADVLRVDAPRLPESEGAHADTGFGKRSTQLDLGRHADRAEFEDLLRQAHVIVTGYRPGALDRFGLAPRELAARRPGLVVARLDAWGTTGPWADRRGFDSLVQAATGIALVEGDGGRPGALPAQALDHGTGYLLAAGVLRALTARRLAAPGSRLIQASLAGTASWLLDGVPPDTALDVPREPAEAGRRHRLRQRDSALGLLRYAPSPVRYVGGPDDWPRPPGPLGADRPVWEAGTPGA
ncbi:CoA transferase [Streptomyces sp. 549]|uniref:CoA transferase n=1 Tax=Streptomyces sp. 549 TaxID=3049076 RepID=UPI0024C22D6A|nr:CoA transferase [Streptomyces sp. 549]MDK1472049.1 CoA transferase [Streptomyces sp. 549]